MQWYGGELEHIVFYEIMHSLLALVLSSVVVLSIWTIQRIMRRTGRWPAGTPTIPWYFLFLCCFFVSWASHIIADYLNWGF